MGDARLIERWLPIAALGEESARERRSMTALPPTYYLHVWWARRPLVASRAAVLASLLPAEADRDRFLHVLGIHGDPVASRRRIDAARRAGERFEGQAYSYPRAFSHVPDSSDRDWLQEVFGHSCEAFSILDPTAGGGSIPFESLRLGAEVFANDLNPVAALVMRATVEWPAQYGSGLKQEFERLAERFVEKREEKLKPYFPPEPQENAVSTNYLWARTVVCPYCDGVVPLSPNWRLASDGTGVRLRPRGGGAGAHAGAHDAGGDTDAPDDAGARVCAFEVVHSLAEQSEGTTARGAASCPWADCGRVIDGGEIKRQAQAGRMGEQLYAVVYKRRVRRRLKSGAYGKDKWVRGYRAPRAEDDNGAAIRGRLAEKLPEWEAFDIVPGEAVPEGHKTSEPLRYGMPLWRDLFSPRQLLCHGTGVEVFREMLEADRQAGKLDEMRQAAYGYLALTLDTVLNYNNRSGRWDGTTRRVRSVFDRHDFAFVWSYAEMAPLVTGIGYDWAIEKTAKCIGELVALVRADEGKGNNKQGLFDGGEREGAAAVPPPVAVTCKSGDGLDHIADGSIDAVVMDPPYYDNVMYAELSDFFYVWLKRTAGRVFPELFLRRLTDKESEAVANPARFAGRKGAQALAGKEYRTRMAAIFGECRRVLKPEGVLTLMFTHKAAGAWDALATGLIEAGFVITASWPVNTEAEGSLHIKDKAAARSTVFLVCRPRLAETGGGEYWEDVEPKVGRAVRARVEEFERAGIGGVDLYLASFGPALEEFSRHWPLKRGTPRPQPRNRRQAALEEAWGRYAVVPEDALDAARREVKRRRLEQLTHLEAGADLDAPTAFFVLAWDAFRAPAFSYDEALRLARAVGVDLDRDVVGRLGEKKGNDVVLWDSGRRAAKGALGSADGSRGMIDAAHHAAHLGRTRTLEAARDLLAESGASGDRRFFAALEAVLEVLPVAGALGGGGAAPQGGAAGAAGDFEALWGLARLYYGEQIDEPEQLKLWREETETAA